jgi:hypothetical protein
VERWKKYTELKVIVSSAMVDIEEREFKLPIRKKFNAKTTQQH